MKYLSITMCLLAVLLLIAAALALYIPLTATIKSRTDEYDIQMNFDQVRRIVVRCDALRYIVAHQYGEVVSQDWSKLNVEGNFRDWDIKGEGQFFVRLASTGDALLHFKECVHITKDVLHSKAVLVRPSGCLKNYVTEMEIRRWEDKTIVRTTVRIYYERHMPLNYKAYVEKQVEKELRKALDNSRDALLQLLEENKDKRFIL